MWVRDLLSFTEYDKIYVLKQIIIIMEERRETMNMKLCHFFI